MIRLLLRLVGIKDYEVCQSCETLKQQLAYERDEKQKLTDTLLNIINPKVIQQQIPNEIAPVTVTSGSFARRRAALEAKDRQEAQILREAKFLGKPDDRLKDKSIDEKIEKLEAELNIPTEQTEEASGE